MTGSAAPVRVIEEMPAYWRVVFDYPPFNIVDATIFEGLQDLLARMLGNVVAAQCMALRLAQLGDAGQAGVQHASLAKAFCTAKMRETTGWARELLAGNGILLEYNVARFVADSEAIYSYEGTREMNSLIVGLAITGQSAFVGK